MIPTKITDSTVTNLKKLKIHNPVFYACVPGRIIGRAQFCGECCYNPWLELLSLEPDVRTALETKVRHSTLILLK